MRNADHMHKPTKGEPCTAVSKRTGHRCKGPAIQGGTVCRMHGGGAPQVKQAALERLMALQHPAIDRMAKLIEQAEFPTVAYQASRDILDRTMGRAHESVSMEVTGTVDVVEILRQRSARHRAKA